MNMTEKDSYTLVSGTGLDSVEDVLFALYETYPGYRNENPRFGEMLFAVSSSEDSSIRRYSSVISSPFEGNLAPKQVEDKLRHLLANMEDYFLCEQDNGALRGFVYSKAYYDYCISIDQESFCLNELLKVFLRWRRFGDTVSSCIFTEQ
jgi:hypothetical protein